MVTDVGLTVPAQPDPAAGQPLDTDYAPLQGAAKELAKQQLPMNNVVMISVELKGLAISPQTSLPSSLPHDVEQSSPYYVVGPCFVTILNIVVGMC